MSVAPKKEHTKCRQKTRDGLFRPKRGTRLSAEQPGVRRMGRKALEFCVLENAVISEIQPAAASNIAFGNIAEPGFFEESTDRPLQITLSDGRIPKTIWEGFQCSGCFSDCGF